MAQPQALREDFYNNHAKRLANSYRILLGEPLLTLAKPTINQLYDAPFALVSHGVGEDPVFNFGNRRALEIFKYSWAQFTCLPSRYSAERLDREQRQILLDQVTEQGFIRSYTGIRIAADGSCFKIYDATVWNLTDEEGTYAGQAAKIERIELI